MKEIKNFNIFGVHRKIQVLGRGGGRVTKNQYIWGNCLKKEDLGSLQIWGGGEFERKRGDVFGGGGGGGGVNTPMYTMLRSRNAIITNFEGWQ